MLITTDRIVGCELGLGCYSESRVRDILGSGLDLRGLWEKRQMLDSLEDFLLVALRVLSTPKLCWLGTDIAVRALPIYEAACPTQDAPRAAIVTVRQYLLGEIGIEQVYPAADAAYTVARDVAATAARAAGIAVANVAYATAGVDDAAHVTSAAAYAAYAITGPSAYGTYVPVRINAEREWQCLRTLEYAEGDPEPLPLPPRE